MAVKAHIKECYIYFLPYAGQIEKNELEQVFIRCSHKGDVWNTYFCYDHLIDYFLQRYYYNGADR